jgi:hypothetical protein
MEGITVSYKTREAKWLDKYRETHYTLPDLARKYGISKTKLATILPAPDLRSPGYLRVMMWEKEGICKLLDKAQAN